MWHMQDPRSSSCLLMSRGARQRSLFQSLLATLQLQVIAYPYFDEPLSRSRRCTYSSADAFSHLVLVMHPSLTLSWPLDLQSTQSRHRR